MSPFEIRPAQPADAEPIEVVRVATWKVAYRGVLPDARLDAMGVSPEIVERRAKQLASGEVAGFVAVRDGEVRGFTMYGPSRDEDIPGTEVYAIYVHAEEFSTGMGRALMAGTLEALTGRQVGLWVLADNQRARRFYERSGFTPSGRTKPNPDDAVEEIHYRLSAST